jgi:hypothetical protein
MEVRTWAGAIAAPQQREKWRYGKTCNHESQLVNDMQDGITAE